MRTYQPCPLANDLFWAKVDKHGPTPEHRPELGPCWIWTAMRRPSGYGQIGLVGPDGIVRKYEAHRVAYTTLRGCIPDQMQLDHLCRISACVNPGHMEPVPQLTNVHRGRKRDLYTHCPEGHEMTEQNTYRIPSTGGRTCRKCRAARRADEKSRARERRQLGLGPGKPGHRRRQPA